MADHPEVVRLRQDLIALTREAPSRDRPIGVEPSLVLPADVGSAPLEDSGHADPLHRPEARIVGREEAGVRDLQE